ncbi:MAG: NAD kinase [Bacteroidetes bacterium]|nr:NAD kinase [Bacteroidota bacterium]
MRLALYSRFGKKEVEIIKSFAKILGKHKIQFTANEHKKSEYLNKLEGFSGFYNSHLSLKESASDYVISFGGDGTVLETLLFVLDSQIPIVGCNTGRLGFLASIGKNDLEKLIEQLLARNFTLESRSVLKIESKNDSLKEPQYALNDVSLHKRDTSAMITVDTFLDEEYFNTYWSDGLLVSTPTGSTAYSLSCGGPLMFPNSSGFIINPVAPHNLNVRPVVVSNNTRIKLVVKGRGTKFLLSLDSRFKVLDYGSEITITKAPFELKFVEINRQTFVNTLRGKLNWGTDHRNKY